MSEVYSKLEITPRTIDLGTKVVQVRQVASVGYTLIYPRRGLGIALLVVAGIFLFGAAISNGLPFGTSGGTLWQAGLGVILGIAGLILTNYTVRFVTIATSDGDKLRLASASSEFLMGVMSRIREAMQAEPGAPLHTTVNISAGTIETNSLVDLSATSVTHSPGALVAGRDVGHGQPSAGTVPANARHANGAGPGGHAGNSAAPPATPGGYANGAYRPVAVANAHAAGSGEMRFELRGNTAHGSASNALAPLANRPGGQQLTISHSPGAVAIGGNADRAMIAPKVEVSPVQDIEKLLALVARSGHPHQDALVGLLKVVEDHLKGGRAGRDDATAHWKSFADYAVKYLTGIDGLLAVTERLSRMFGRAAK